MPLNYYVWVISNPSRNIVVDTGFNEAMAAKRGRQIVKPVAQGLSALGLQPDSVADVIVTHLHYDHAGNIPLFPQARFHLQDKEMEFATGRCMCHDLLSHGYEADDVANVVRCVFDRRVQYHDGAAEIAPGVEVHHIGGHTKGLQAVRVRTTRGWVVLASDASHFYAHMEQGRAFPVLYNLGDMLEGYKHLASIGDLTPPYNPRARPPGDGALSGGRQRYGRLDCKIGSRTASMTAFRRPRQFAMAALTADKQAEDSRLHTGCNTPSCG
jgi:glyoxylase-like metal-dependent hydrolase (beta-lactamase superfamily II)